MVKLLIWVMVAAVVMAGAVFFKKKENKKKTYIVVIGSLSAAAIALWVQGSLSWHMSLLAIFGLSLVTALFYMKMEEREQKEKLRLKEQRQQHKKQSTTIPAQAKDLQGKPVNEQESKNEKSDKVFGMESIGPVGKGN